MSTIYVVEDDEGVQLSLEALLESKGFEVRSFGTGGAFLTAHDGVADAVLLLDLNLPDMTGNDVIEALTGRGQEIPVIVMTGAASEMARQRALDLGAVTVFDKPLNAPLLLQTIHSLL